MVLPKQNHSHTKENFSFYHIFEHLSTVINDSLLLFENSVDSLIRIEMSVIGDALRAAELSPHRFDIPLPTCTLTGQKMISGSTPRRVDIPQHI